jgi:hypothetical protein
MSPEFKVPATILLQARVDGKLSDAGEFFDILLSNKISPTFSFQEMSDFMKELIPCDNIPEAQIIAKKYDLTINF